MSEVSKLSKEAILLEKREKELADALNLLYECRQQIDYLHHKFRPTGTGNALINRVTIFIDNHDSRTSIPAKSS